ncbi:methyl-accepting chemotaxis protein [Pseudorhizobium tarimense]|uniref:methyl-accepting chemotaxis protein n=1 Tax=Pseudorhizobium tarimense TaxID=1079109 RepID=UPI001FF45ED8|nr:methyl-accepting chemotaxis protein [Pseudorhizobium tarimense]MCJ8520757.1 methyl-accepting chemotaxis protein [Pseudorhizobium tarimense]
MSSIRSKMLFIGLGMFVLAGGAAGTGLWSAKELTNNVVEVSTTADLLRNHMQADMMHDALRADVLSAILAQDPTANIDIDDVKADLADHVSSFRSSIAANKGLAAGSSISSVLAELDSPLQAYIDGASSLINEASTDRAKALAGLPTFKALFSDLETAMSTAGDSIQKLSDDVMRDSEALSSLINKMLMSLLGVTLTAALAVIYASRRTMILPIKALSDDMQKLAGGQTDLTLQGKNRKDEIGDMAAAVEVFRLAAIANKQLETQAIAQREAAESDRMRLAAEAEATARLKLQQATSSLATGLRRLASGDLSFQLTEPFAPDFEDLRHDLNATVEQLSATLTSVAHAAGSIDSGTREIRMSSDDLCNRTEQQAAFLEQTAAALDEITANVSNASKRAEEARNVAIDANKSAARSGVVVANAVQAMQRIEQSSEEISSIIGVIDEIAFQTNLLALNAGVEAARAGDAGKGFAVVAQEVRELAQRSAKAAKEIKDLIRNSSSEVDCGVKLVQDTGEALTAIGQYVATINQHMDAIATSSREQSLGLAEVNTAVNQMDQVTQRNAAMVEETTAASAALASESRKLHELVSQFQVAKRSDESRKAA